ncbi:MAG: proton-conducting transporter membrane subunit [Hyphomonadaceae bacterium]|nr:proton-conducting transporter membrane subunit [Hyphomonadaceae bacterium]
MTPVLALLLTLALPAASAVLTAILRRPPGLRDVIHIGFACALATACAYLLQVSLHQETPARLVLARPLPNVELAFVLEPLGALMGAVLGGLGVLHAIHTVGFVRATQELAPARTMSFLSFGAAATLAVMYSANLFTFFVAYQALTLATFPLVALGGGDEGRRAARTYLAVLLAASVGLFLPAMVWTYALTGVIDFRIGGALAGRVDEITANVLLALFTLGVAMAAIPPVHGWLSASNRASFPSLTAIQSLAVIPAGGVGVLKITAYVFGAAMHDARWAALGLLVVVGVSMCGAALIALSRQDIRERLAYSAMAQSLAAAMGALLALPAGAFAAALQLVSLTCAGATLVMAAGTVFATTGRTNVADYSGLGRAMPWTFAAFAIGAASMIGMPPFSGAWAKLWLITAAADAGLHWAAVMAGVTAVLTFAHLAPLAASALAGPAPTDPFKRPDGASVFLVAPAILSALATLWLLVLADPLATFLAPLWAEPP